MAAPFAKYPSLWHSYLLYDHALRIIRSRLEDYYSKHDVDLRHVWVLMAADDLPSNQKAIAEALGINPNVMVNIVNTMEEKCLIKRAQNPDNRREHILVPTEKGKDVLSWALKGFEPDCADVFYPLTMNQVATIEHLAYSVIHKEYDFEKS